MGVNLFVPINRADATSVNIEKVTAAVNSLGNDDNEPFDWAGLFHDGNGDHLLTMTDALAFEPDAAPWFVMTLDPEFFSEADDGHYGAYTEFFYCHPDAAPSDNESHQWGYTRQHAPANWQALLAESKCDAVLFYKARN